MPTPLRKPRRSFARQQNSRIEPLEKRTLLTAIINGIFPETGTNIFEYKQADDSSIRISVFGNVTAEFIGARVRPARLPDTFDALVIRDLVPAGSEGDGVNLFSIYVVRSDINSVISIAQVPDPSATQGRFMSPFDGSAGSITIFDATTQREIQQIETGPGAVFLGARTREFQGANAQDLNDRPIITPPDNRRRFGLRPASAGQMFAGLEVAAGNDLGKFMLGGTITGLVDVQGSMRLFYAGGILTGDAIGLAETDSSSIPRNFYVNGDLEQLVVGTSLGTSLTLDQEEIEDVFYKTGFQLEVKGRIGWIRAIDSFLGSVVVQNNKNVTGLGIAQTELEFSGRTLPTITDESYFDAGFRGTNASLGTKAPNAAFNNDTFDTAQHLGTLTSTQLNSREAIQIRGFTDTTNGDPIDFYAVSLLAGQNIQVQLLNSFSALGIIDPDGRLIASDYSNGRDRSVRLNKPFRFTADRPGPYRIVVANRGDINFNGVIDDGETISSISPDPYELRIQRVADIALGGLIADVHIATYDLGSNGITVMRGDIGSVRAGILGTGTIFSLSNPWVVAEGNLRSVEAVSMGIIRSDPTLTYVGRGPDFLVPRGSIGLLRTTGLDPGNTILVCNEHLVSNIDDLELIDPGLAVGKDIQLVDCASNFQGDLLANGAIGVIRAASVATINLEEPGVWAVNVDKKGNDGRIDLVDVSGDLGLLGNGGPAISTGPEGNVRYMRVAGTTFRDRFFGAGSPEPTVFQPGEIVTLTEDNGTDVVMRAIPRVPATDPVTGLPIGGLFSPGILTVQSYPIRDKAGVVIMRVVVDSPLAAVGRGLQVDSVATLGGSVEIGEIFINSPGTDQTFDPFTRAFTPAATGQPSDVLINGNAPVDVWSIECRVSTGGTFTGLTRVVNRTAGEIVNVRASHIGQIDADSVGLARQSTGAAVNAVGVAINGYPFNQQRNLVAAISTGGPAHIVQIRARRSLGNILAQGTIGSVVANSDGRNIAATFEGVSGPIVAVHSAGTALDTGNIVSVSIGEGVLSSGSGDVAFAGIFADGLIDRVRNTGLGSDIRGNIVSRGDTPPPGTRVVNGVVQTTPNFFIGDIILNNGAIIDANIMTVATFVDSREIENIIVIPQRGNILTDPVFEIRSIQIQGNGGIIGADITADDIGPIIINNGFGVINTSIGSLGDSVIDGIITDGYGVRSTTIQGGAILNQVIARGAGKRLDTREWTPSVRNSERMSFDPVSGYLLEDYNDLHKFLNTTAANPKNVSLSNAGVIEDSQFVGSRSLGRIEAHRIIGREVFEFDANGQRRRIPSGRADYPMRISFGQSTGTVRTRDYIDGLALITGGLTLFEAGKDVLNTAINVTGRIRTINAGANLRGSVSIKAQGSQGRIDSITTKRANFATIEASVDIGTIKSLTDLGSGLIRVGRNLSILNVAGSILSGANINVGRTLGTLIIGQDLQADATIRADAIGTQQIGGQVLGDIIIT